ncbi:Imm1 family immunity protein [Nocardia crassostreae]|uniref:Imm1 family immunity protein n=1 Tax=Nocardia crassostreae TaxID=53428 RepID=UPI001470FD5C|nr:Imm1 family immunity protein [Nocardia crassostreae]
MRTFPTTHEEIGRAVTDAIEHSSATRSSVSFALTPASAEFPAACLTVAISADRTCGALVWMPSGHLLAKGGVYGNIWISDNPEPPSVDPELFGDAHTGRMHDPASAVPIDRVRADTTGQSSKSDRPIALWGW